MIKKIPITFLDRERNDNNAILSSPNLTLKKPNCRHSFNEDSVLLLYRCCLVLHSQITFLQMILCCRWRFLLLACDATLLLFAFNRNVCERWGEKMVPSDSWSCSRPCPPFSLSISLPLSNISNERWHAGSQQGVTGDTRSGAGGVGERGLTFHRRLACPWKLIVRGSFALDM